MFLENTQEDYTRSIIKDNTLPVLYLDELYDKITNFKYSEFTLPSISDGCKNKEFKDKLFDFTCIKLNIIKDELLNEFLNINDENSKAIANLIQTKYSRFQTVIIEYLFEGLTFNYLRKISNDIKDKKYADIKNIYELLNSENYNIKDLLIELLHKEIQKIENIGNTMETIANQIQNKEQFKKLINLKNASTSVSKKVMQENLLIINILETCPKESLKELVFLILDDKMVSSNLVD